MHLHHIKELQADRALELFGILSKLNWSSKSMNHILSIIAKGVGELKDKDLVKITILALEGTLTNIDSLMKLIR